MIRKQDSSEGYDSMEVNLDDWDQLNDIYDSNHTLDRSVQESTYLYQIDSDNEVAPNIYDDDNYDSNPDDFQDMAREINVDPFSWKTNICNPPPLDSMDQTLKNYGVKTAHEYAVLLKEFEISGCNSKPPPVSNSHIWVNDQIIKQQAEDDLFDDEYDSVRNWAQQAKLRSRQQELPSEGDLFDDQLLIDGSYNHMDSYTYETAARRSARLAKLRANQEDQETESHYANYIKQHSQPISEPVEKKEIDTNMNIVVNPQYTVTNQYQVMMAARNIDLNKLISEYDIEPLIIRDDMPKRKDNLPPPEKIDPTNLPQYILDLLNEPDVVPEQVPDAVPIDDAQVAAQIAKDQQNKWISEVIIKSEKDKFEKEQYSKWISEVV